MNATVPVAAGTPRAERYRTRWLRFDELDARIIDAWAALEERALEPNAFLSPCFVVPAVRNLSSPADRKKLVFIFVERVGGAATQPRLVGAGVFVKSLATKRFPLPHLVAYRSCHSYVSGVLLDRQEAEGAARALLASSRGRLGSWHGIELVDRRADGAQARLLEALSADLGAGWHEYDAWPRAVFHAADAGEAFFDTQLPRKRRQDLRRARRRLERQGEVGWNAAVGQQLCEARIQRFLELEDLGWKGDEGTSLRSQQSHERFFREMVAEAKRRDRLLLTELTLDGRAIAAATVLLSGNAGFGFKLGWDPHYRKMAPGLLNQVELIRHLPAMHRQLDYIDSGASAGSFIEKLWVHRHTLCSGVFAMTRLGGRALAGVEIARRLKRWTRSLAQRASDQQ